MKVKDVLSSKISEKAPKGFVPYIEIGDIDVVDKTYTLKEKESVSGAVFAEKNAILVSTVRPTRGAITILKEDKAAVSGAFAILYPNEEKCLREYLFFQLNNKKFFEYLGSNSKGATYPTCSKDDIFNYEIIIPSLDEQHKVVSILKLITKAIAINKKNKELCDELTKSRFVELFDNDLKNTNRTIGDIADEATVGIANSATHAYTDSGVVMLRNQNIRINYLDDSDLIYIKQSFADKYKNKALKENDILITRTGANIGMACLVPQKYEGCQTFTTLILRLKEDISIKPSFVCRYLNSPYGYDYIHENMVGGAQPNFGAKQLVQMPICIPEEAKQNEFERFIKQIDKSKYICQKKIELYQELLDKKMDEYFNPKENEA